jgi:cytoskeletal protein RodZ
VHIWQTFCTQGTSDTSLGGSWMKNRFQAFSSLLALGVVLGLITLGGSLQAQQTSPQTQQPAPETQQPQQQAPTQYPDQSGQQTASPEQQQQPSTQPNQPSGQTSQPPDSQAQSSDPSGVQTFTGTVVKQGDKYMLQDAASGTTYDIDHQDEVKKFEGKKVRVHGTLDASGKMIHVQ